MLLHMFAMVGMALSSPSLSVRSDNQCGKSGHRAHHNFIVGGRFAEKNEYPWQVLLHTGCCICGGSVISKNKILTAAHCTRDFSNSQLTVTVEEHEIDQSDGERDYKVCERQEHPGYKNAQSLDSMDSDIAILTLCEDLTFSESLRPVCLPESNLNEDDVEAEVAGWGVTGDGNISTILQSVTVKTMNYEECNLLYGHGITENMICATAPGADSCQGDSGGALVTKRDGRFQQIGIVSFGLTCADPEKPGVYTRVANYLDWIHQNM